MIMKRGALVVATLAGLFTLTASGASAGLQDENVLVPLPDGFKQGYRSGGGQRELTEFVPAAETVNSWSQMVTEITLRGLGQVDGETLQATMLAQWKAACPGADGHHLESGKENGYATSYWTFSCPRNPQTGQSESMVRKVIVGKDAIYDVQYAYKKTAEPELVRSSTAYLRRVIVCDTRTPEHPCPADLTPVSPRGSAASNPVEAFLHAADSNDVPAMRAVLDPASANILTKIDKCYLRRVLSNTQTHEIVALWMCALGPERSRVVLASVAPTVKGQAAVTLVQEVTNNRPAPERTGSAFAN